ncbi:MAG TPA: acyltransferase [Acidimicrobiia bacterium]|nr:acyltransferase [Acidimicrobiia bacterium]
MSDTAQPPKNDQIAFIHILSCAAILLVMWSHFSGMWLVQKQIGWKPQELWVKLFVTPFHIYQNGGHLAVLLFFLVSGYIITHTSLRESHLDYAVKRAVRILPVLIVGSLIAWGIARYGAPRNYLFLGEGTASVKRWISSLFLLDGFRTPARMVSVTWTLFIEVVFYIFTFALLSISRKNPLRATWMMVGLYIVAFLIMHKVSYFQGSPNTAAITLTAFFIVGRAIYLWHKGHTSGFDSFLVSATCLFVFVLFTEADDPGYLFRYKGYEAMATYVAGLIIFLACLRWSPRSVFKPISIIADISNSIYILHVPVGLLVINILGERDYPYTLIFVCAVAVTFAVSYLSYLAIELPTRKAGRALLKRYEGRKAALSTDAPVP